MPFRVRPALLSLLLAALASVALAGWATSAQAGVTVAIQPPGNGSPATISTDDVAEKDRDMYGPYTISRPSGSPLKLDIPKGSAVSLIKLLELTNTNFDYATITIQRPNGRALTLTKDDVKSVKPPGFYTDEQGVTHFIGVTGSNRQVAAKDYFEVSGTIFVNQERKSKLEVTIKPKEKKAELGDSITFKATIKGLDDPTDEVVYSWTVDGKAQRSTNTSYTHKLSKNDHRYKVLVTAEVVGGASDSDVATITVGDPDRDKTEGNDGTEDSPPATSGSAPYSGDSGSPAPYVPVTPSSPTPPTPEPTEPPDIVTSGTPVEGNLLADVSDPPPSNILESARRAARDGTPKADESADVGVSEAAISIVGALALLGLGAGLETRQGRLPRLRLPRRAA